MSYTLSFDASLKVKKTQVKGLSNHNFRDILDNGYEEGFNHSNENIDNDLTKDNDSYYYNQETGQYTLCSDISQIQESLETRLATVKKPLRKDAVVARGIILQLDPEWYKDNKDEKRNTGADMLQWAAKTFGRENLVGFSFHKDETNPHLHILFTPVTSDGRLNQKEWFSDPVTLRSMHDDFRKHMIDKGFDISLERKPRRKHMSEKEYKAFKQSEEKQEELQDWQKDLKQQKDSIIKRENAVLSHEEDLKVKEHALDVKKAHISELEAQAEKYVLETKETLKKANISFEDYLKYQSQWMKKKGYSEECLKDYFAKIDSQYPNISQLPKNDDFSL